MIRFHNYENAQFMPRFITPGGGSGGGAYDDVYQPVELGSGGGGGCGLAGGAGGGAIQLDVTNGLVLNGLFTANGLVGIGADYCGGTGGGSGGSIWIKAGEMSGSGVIQANGGMAGQGVWIWRSRGAGCNRRAGKQ